MVHCDVGYDFTFFAYFHRSLTTMHTNNLIILLFFFGMVLGGIALAWFMRRFPQDN